MALYFTDDEIKCKCGCGLIIHNQELEDIMDGIRDAFGHPLSVNSWTRCFENNASQPDAKPDSAHLKGLAVDISTPTSSAKFDILNILFTSTPITRVGIGRTFVHIDIDSSKPSNVCWVYG